MKVKLHKFILLLFLVALVAVTALTGCNGREGPQPFEGDAIAIGQGETVFRFEVTDRENNVTAWDVNTNEATVGAALSAVGLIDGEETGFVTVVNGITADFNVDGSWWAFYVDGEMAMVGIYSTYVESGSIYAFVFTAG